MKSSTPLKQIQNCGSSVQDHTGEKERMFENVISTYKGNDPLGPRYDFLTWMKKWYKGRDKKEKINQLLKEIIDLFKYELRYKQDLRFIEILIEYVEFQENKSDLYRSFFQQGFGTTCAMFYISWANSLLAINYLNLTNEVYEMGIRYNAEPVEILQQAQSKIAEAVKLRRACFRLQQYPTCVKLQDGTWKIVNEPRAVDDEEDLCWEDILNIRDRNKKEEQGVKEKIQGDLTVCNENEGKSDSLICPVAVFEPFDPKKKPMYQKQKIYGSSREKQFEEIMEEEWYKKRIEKKIKEEQNNITRTEFETNSRQPFSVYEETADTSDLKAKDQNKSDDECHSKSEGNMDTFTSSNVHVPLQFGYEDAEKLQPSSKETDSTDPNSDDCGTLATDDVLFSIKNINISGDIKLKATIVKQEKQQSQTNPSSSTKEISERDVSDLKEKVSCTKSQVGSHQRQICTPKPEGSDEIKNILNDIWTTDSPDTEFEMNRQPVNVKEKIADTSDSKVKDKNKSDEYQGKCEENMDTLTSSRGQPSLRRQPLQISSKSGGSGEPRKVLNDFWTVDSPDCEPKVQRLGTMLDPSEVNSAQDKTESTDSGSQKSIKKSLFPSQTSEPSEMEKHEESKIKEADCEPKEGVKKRSAYQIRMGLSDYDMVLLRQAERVAAGVRATKENTRYDAEDDPYTRFAGFKLYWDLSDFRDNKYTITVEDPVDDKAKVTKDANLKQRNDSPKDDSKCKNLNDLVNDVWDSDSD